MMGRRSTAAAVEGPADAERRIESAFGAEALVGLEGGASSEVEVIPTGALSLDLALGIGGFPRGRIVEVYGPPPGQPHP
jgi:recombination protein RecA